MVTDTTETNKFQLTLKNLVYLIFLRSRRIITLQHNWKLLVSLIFLNNFLISFKSILIKNSLFVPRNFLNSQKRRVFKTQAVGRCMRINTELRCNDGNKIFNKHKRQTIQIFPKKS